MTNTITPCIAFSLHTKSTLLDTHTLFTSCFFLILGTWLSCEDRNLLLSAADSIYP